MEKGKIGSIRTPKPLNQRVWAVKISNFEKSKMANGRHVEKSINGRISGKAQPTCTKFGTVMQIGTSKHTSS